MSPSACREMWQGWRELSAQLPSLLAAKQQQEREIEAILALMDQAAVPRQDQLLWKGDRFIPCSCIALAACKNAFSDMTLRDGQTWDRLSRLFELSDNCTACNVLKQPVMRWKQTVQADDL